MSVFTDFYKNCRKNIFENNMFNMTISIKASEDTKRYVKSFTATTNNEFKSFIGLLALIFK